MSTRGRPGFRMNFVRRNDLFQVSTAYFPCLGLGHHRVIIWSAKLILGRFVSKQIYAHSMVPYWTDLTGLFLVSMYMYLYVYVYARVRVCARACVCVSNNKLRPWSFLICRNLWSMPCCGKVSPITLKRVLCALQSTPVHFCHEYGKLNFYPIWRYLA